MPKISPLIPGQRPTPTPRPEPVPAAPKVEATPVNPPTNTQTPAPIEATTNSTPDTSVSVQQPDSDDAKRFAALSRREKQIREREQALKAAEGSKGPGLQDLQQLAQQDIGAVLSKLGVSDEQIVAHYTQQRDPNAQRYQALERKLSAFEQAQQSAQEAQQASQKQQYDVALKKFRTDAETMAASDERFASVKAVEAYDEVVDRIESHFKATGEVKKVEEVMAEVETELEATVLSLAKLSKFAAKLAPPAPKVEEPPKPAKPEATLTHRVTASTKPALSKSELRQRMIDRINGILPG